jgi:TctA family transporter
LLLGLLVASEGLDNPAGFPRFTFGIAELAGGLTLIPIMIGMFAVSEILRSVTRIDEPWEMAQVKIGNVLHGMWGLTKRYPWQLLRGSVVGTAIGALPGAGADIAAWMSYAISKRFSKEPEKFGTGHIEGIIEAGASNNSALAGAWIPALVFGIPGDSITAIVIGVLYIKGLNPGPTIFMNNAASIYAVFMVFILANLLMLPLGIAAIRAAKQMLRAPREVLLPVILLFCIVGSFAINNSIFGVVLMLAFGIVGYVMEENGFPIAPAILGMVLGAMLEENFISSMIKADGRLLAFFERPIAGTLGVLAIAVFAVPLVRRTIGAATARP